jgi:hypothetical protein
MNPTELLEKIGFEPQEAKAYLSLLTLGEATAGDIAKHAGLVRTSCYYTLQKLHQKGIAHSYVKRGVRYWGAEGPRWLASRIDEQKSALDYLMPQLLAMQATFGAKPSFTYYEGADGVKEILNDILKDRHNLLSMSSLEDAVALLGQQFNFFIAKRSKLKLAVRFITNRSPVTVTMQQTDESELRHTHFLPPGKEIKNMNFVYGDKIAILSMNRKLPMGVIIQDPDIAQTQRILFEALWQECNHYGQQTS